MADASTKATKAEREREEREREIDERLSKIIVPGFKKVTPEAESSEKKDD